MTTTLALSVGSVQIRQPSPVELANADPMGHSVSDCASHLLELAQLAIVGRFACAGIDDAVDLVARFTLPDARALLAAVEPAAGWSPQIVATALDGIRHSASRSYARRASLTGRRA